MIEEKVNVDYLLFGFDSGNKAASVVITLHAILQLTEQREKYEKDNKEF